MRLVQYRRARAPSPQPRQPQRGGEHHQHVAQHRRHLRAHQIGDFVDKLFDPGDVVHLFELGGHCRRGHCRLLGGDGEVQHLDQHKADGVVDARQKAAPKRRQRQRVQGKFNQRGKRHHRAAASGVADHCKVFAPGAGDVVLARFGAALGHFGRQQRGVGREQRADAAPLLADLYQVRQHARRAQVGGGREHAIEQLAHPQDARAQLAQAKHQADGDAVVLKVQIHAGRRTAAALQPGAQALGGVFQPVGGAQAVQHFNAQALDIADQRMKRLRLARRVAHAQAQLGGKAGRQNLPGAVGDGIEQGFLPARAAGTLGRKRRHQALEQRFGQRRQQLGIEGIRQRQRKQLGGVKRLGAAGQQLAAQALGQFAKQPGARRKAKVGQQRGDIDRLTQRLPPVLQALAGFGIGLQRFHQQLHAGDTGRHRVTTAAHPVKQLNQPQMALGYARLRVNLREQVR